jgi:hypothetical protein
MISKAKGSKILLRRKYFGSSKNTQPLSLSFFTTAMLYSFSDCAFQNLSAFGRPRKKKGELVRRCAAAACLGRAMRK